MSGKEFKRQYADTENSSLKNEYPGEVKQAETVTTETKLLSWSGVYDKCESMEQDKTRQEKTT